MSNPFKLTGKAALVTGGNGGIGLGIARGLAQAGARIAIIARNTEKSHAAAKALAEETGVVPWVLSADVSVPNQVAAVVSEAKNGLGRIDILFNNAGISIRKLPQDLTPEADHTVLSADHNPPPPAPTYRVPRGDVCQRYARISLTTLAWNVAVSFSRRPFLSKNSCS